MKPRVLVLAGPTASGKTDLSLALAREYPLEPVNADGLQVFRRMDIGTAKPTAGELGPTPYHLIDVLNPDQEITAAWYAGEARRVVGKILDRGRTPLLVGGSGFYLRALEHPPIAVPPARMEEPTEGDHARLQTEDPVTAARIHPNDRYRIGRAVALLNMGIVPSRAWASANAQEPEFEFVWIGLHWDRPVLHDRIGRRVAEMFQKGLAGETSSVLTDYPAAGTRLKRAIGYRQAMELLAGRIDEAKAIELATYATRQYAKRQITWFKKEKRIGWIDASAAFDKARAIVEKVVGP